MRLLSTRTMQMIVLSIRTMGEDDDKHNNNATEAANYKNYAK